MSDRARRCTVYEADRSGQCWDLCTTESAAYALLSVRAGRAARPTHAFGIYWTDDPEAGDCEAELEEEEIA